jgi:hypothetical protein
MIATVELSSIESYRKHPVGSLHRKGGEKIEGALDSLRYLLVVQQMIKNLQGISRRIGLAAPAHHQISSLLKFVHSKPCSAIAMLYPPAQGKTIFAFQNRLEVSKPLGIVRSVQIERSVHRLLETGSLTLNGIEFDVVLLFNDLPCSRLR